MSALEGRRAVVTGGGTGIGLAVARRLAEEGATVVLMARDRARIESAASRIDGATAIPCDVTDEASVKSAFADAAADGPVEILIANAGAAESAPLARTDAALWRRMLDVNLTGAYLCARAVAPALREADYGRVVTIASTAGMRGYPYVSAYCAAKHGAVGLMRALAAEFAQTSVTFNAVCPGFTDTDLLDASVARIMEKTGRPRAAAREALAANNPQGRLIAPDEVASAVAWLCAPENGSITGQSLAIAGGEVA